MSSIVNADTFNALSFIAILYPLKLPSLTIATGKNTPEACCSCIWFVQPFHASSRMCFGSPGICLS